MSYRKLKIEDKEYEYVIGKKFTKVKHMGKAFGIYHNHEHGNQVVSVDAYGMNFYPQNGYFVVTPENVRRMILNLPKPIFTTPEGETPYLMVNPFDSEIHEKIKYLPFSFKNYGILLDEI